MKERPILFSGPMVRAILEGRKTQTRRIISPPNGYRWLNVDVGTMVNDGGHKKHITDLPRRHGVAGDRLWVRETTYDVERNGFVGPVFVESDEGTHAAAWGWGESDDPDYVEPYELRKRPAIHMPRSMARITLEVIGVRAERLQSIEWDEAIAEGIPDPRRAGRRVDPVEGTVAQFRQLWDGLNAARGYGWDTNPWVWRIEFRRVKK
ncbi:hypothetical protein BTN_2264 [Burkholderia thailandensis E254]|uniref:hypothetical protein n=1 Tax=Burkholderia thailandensis TaxID=57975 RepID=UPI000517B1CC|nr:hypothetical protein [Burkholderia thailandensis]AIT19297.1 hypothetical protein BTN_2264 [Burkholderia thailandensis E254]MUV28891.1 hypothetical protein [Burkholderia thailandensis]PNE70350.1 hypothetical protein A8H38_31795 [Burkholderia thailandensis]PNE70421.1 hypothetical protein A8H38_32195 [Burkholderia thailandensis]